MLAIAMFSGMMDGISTDEISNPKTDFEHK
jgi:hypothetical protein